MKKPVDYQKYANLLIQDISQVLTNDDRKIESQQKTITTYKDRLRVLIDYFIKNSVDINKIDKYDVEKIFKHIQNTGYVRGNKHRVYSKSTMRLFKVVANKYFEFLKSEKVIRRNKANPFNERLNINIKSTEYENLRTTKAKYLSDKDIHRVLSYISHSKKKGRGRKRETFDKLYEAVLLMMTFGLRVSELANIERSDFTVLDNGLIKLYIKPSKRQKERDTYYLFDNLFRHNIEQIISFSNFDYNVNTVKKQIQRISKELKLTNLSTHSFRHTFGTSAVNKGISHEVIASMLGHSDIRTTKIYAKLLNLGIESSLLKIL